MLRIYVKAMLELLFYICDYFIYFFIAECRIRGGLMFELHAVMAEDARRSSQNTSTVMEALLVSR